MFMNNLQMRLLPRARFGLCFFSLLSLSYIRMNHLESRLAAFVDNGCRYDKRIEVPYPTWRRPPLTSNAATAAIDADRSIWMSGRIMEINKRKNILTVERIQPPIDRMKGYVFWTQAGSRAIEYDPQAKARLNVVATWIESGDASRRYSFRIDSTTLLFRNGHEATIDDLQAGDFVGVCCGLGLSDHKDAIKPIHIRAYRMSKPPATSVSGSSVLVPQIEGQWWQVAGNPDLGNFTSGDQQPVDFAVWQAADGTWQLWSCIRKTNCGGNTRLFHGWEGRRLTDKHWKPLGVVMQAEPKFGESPGSLQAPHVIRRDGTYYMFYGDWDNTCLAMSQDGKNFRRQIRDNGKTGMFSEGIGEHARDPMILQVDDRYHCYYTAHSMRSPASNHRGVNYCRVSTDLRNWGPSKVVAEGSAYGKGPYCAECPHVVYHPKSKHYYLFNTQRYGLRQHTTVFRSADPLRFGINDNRFEVATLPVAAPEIILHDGRYYIASLMPELKGIRIAKLKWVPEARD